MTPQSKRISLKCSPLQSLISTRHTYFFRRKQNRDPPASENAKTTPSGQPPVLVIRATSSYGAQEATQLSFEIGDFFHVVDLLTDDDGCAWFRVENPEKSMSQGLVPVNHFQKYAPTRPGNLVPIHKHPNHHPTEPPSHQDSSKTKGLSPTKSTSPPPEDELRISLSPQGVQPSNLNKRYRTLFGTVKYSFVAERADEMSAFLGEPVVVVAQSAQEWFVVKPICRLGPPGLIPASYVELQEIKTCQVLSPEQVAHLMQTSAIPTVDEWKKIVADHKARCISLGVIAEKKDSDSTNTSKSTPSPLENSLSITVEENWQTVDWRQRHATFIQCVQQDNGLSRVEEEDETEDCAKDQTRTQIILGTLWEADVISFHHEQGQFWYQVQARLRSSSDNTSSQTVILYRLDTDFRKLECELQKEFPSEDYIAPQLSASVPPTDEIACAHRIEQLRYYMEEVCALPESIRSSEALCDFLRFRHGDMEVDTADEEEFEIPRKNCTSKLSPPILQLPLEANDSYENMVDLEQSFGNSERKGETLSNDDRSWITSWQATASGECRFSNDVSSPSTRPSSIESHSSSPTVENHNLGSAKPSSRQSVLLPDLGGPINANSDLIAENEVAAMCIPAMAR